MKVSALRRYICWIDNIFILSPNSHSNTRSRSLRQWDYVSLSHLPPSLPSLHISRRQTPAPVPPASNPVNSPVNQSAGGHVIGCHLTQRARLVVGEVEIPRGKKQLCGISSHKLSAEEEFIRPTPCLRSLAWSYVSIATDQSTINIIFSIDWFIFWFILIFSNQRISNLNVFWFFHKTILKNKKIFWN